MSELGSGAVSALHHVGMSVADLDKSPADATPNPGNVHVCLAVEDAPATWSRAVDAGARPVVAEGPVEIDAGPNNGGWAAYLRIHDGITLELIQLASR